MYVSAHDSSGAVGVGVFSGASQPDANYQAAIDDITAANRAAGQRGGPSVFALFVDGDVPPPPALWRKRFSEVNQQLPHTPHYMLLVTQSQTARGVFTAITWLTGTPAGHTYKAMPSAAAADEWLAAELGAQFAVIVRLETQARGDVRRAAEG